MRKLILSLSFCLIAGIAFGQDEFKGQKFGEVIHPGNVLTTSKIESALGENKKGDLKIEGKVLDVCKKKGCWMTLEVPGAEPMRVTFKDYAFFMPMDIVGKKVVLDGIATKEITSVDDLQHYAEDAHKSEAEIAKITKPKKEITFEAKGVVILEK
ncbi:DUF4920 domain-containing protein [Pedobacter sp. MW01-1-1]|uniref:DUF4920 domain-containing protein n=1 Tax=Pedobacter sp. MW01-1-1 TaxID=3383027 RepID=UPI003FEE4D5C